MSVWIAFLLVALGVALDAVHNYIRRTSEYRAYQTGYKQAQKEENIRVTTRVQVEGEVQRRLNASEPSPVPPLEGQQIPFPSSVQRSDIHVTNQFMQDLRENGRAFVKLR